MPITVESAVKSDEAARKSAAGKKVLAGKVKIPRFVWIAGALGLGYVILREFKPKKVDIQSSNVIPPAQSGSEGSHG